jgi:protein-disulfide isomerase
MATTKKKRQSTRQRRGGISTTHILIVAGAAVLVVALLVILNTNRPQVTATDLTYETGTTPDGEPYKGSPDAPIKLVEYSDFLCSHCGNLSDALEALSPEYVKTGKLQISFRNYAFLTPQSIEAAQAAECALDQGADKFWLYHNLLFANRGNGLAAYSNPSLKTYARQIGLDVEAFDQCLDSGAKLERVQADKAEGDSQGVQGTPTWFINGRMESGDRTEDELRQIFDAMLSQTP